MAKLDADVFMYHTAKVINEAYKIPIRKAIEIVTNHWSYKAILKDADKEAIKQIRHDPFELWADQIYCDSTQD